MVAEDIVPVNFLYTNIGRGHPHYLDGIIECLPPDRIGTVADVFSVTSGAARRAWGLARVIYRAAVRGGMYSRLYSWMRVRNDFNRGGWIQAVMGRPLRRVYLDDPAPLVVAHPLLVAVLAGKRNLIYQHGEVAVPREARVGGGRLILVPLSRTADAFLAAGFQRDRLFVSGLCIEPGLVSQAERAFDARLERLAGSGSLCGAFFSSGAEPRQHVEKLSAAAISAVAAGGRIVAFARRSGVLGARLSASFAERGWTLESVRSVEGLSGLRSQDARALLCLYNGRRQLNELTEKLFGEFDYFVAPSHERTSWALGLGLPMFIVDPPLGSFSPLNREFLLASSLAGALETEGAASRLGAVLEGLRDSGALCRMAEAGWGRFDIRGFANIAEALPSL